MTFDGGQAKTLQRPERRGIWPSPQEFDPRCAAYLSEGGRGSIMGIYEDHGNGREKKGIKWDT